MKIELYYVVQKYAFESFEELNPVFYKAGPFAVYHEAYDFISGEWLYNNAYVITKQVIDVEEV